MRFELKAPTPPRRGPDKVVERIYDRSAESLIQRPRPPKKVARSGELPGVAPGAFAPNQAARVLDGPRGSACRRCLAAVGLEGASTAMRARHLSAREEPKGVIMRETDEGGCWVLRVGKGI